MDRQNQLAEEIWIEQASHGDLDAFNQLVLKYQDPAYRHALWLSNDGWLADEVVQDSFLKAFQNLNGFRGGSFRAWLMRIVTNTAYDYLRRSAKHSTLPLNPEEDGDELESPAWLADPNASVEAAAEKSEQVQFIYQALNELQETYRNVIVLIDLQDFDYQEAAQTLNIPLGTVKSRLARARLQLSQILSGQLVEGNSIFPSTLVV